MLLERVGQDTLLERLGLVSLRERKECLLTQKITESKYIKRDTNIARYG